MPRNASGAYSLVSGNPVVAHARVLASWINTTLADIAAEITNSLDRSGRGAMSGPLKHANGTVSAPAITFDAEQTSGLYRAAQEDLRFAVGGADVLRLLASGPNYVGVMRGGRLAAATTLTPADWPVAGSYVEIASMALPPGAWAIKHLIFGTPTFNTSSEARLESRLLVPGQTVDPFGAAIAEGDARNLVYWGTNSPAPTTVEELSVSRNLTPVEDGVVHSGRAYSPASTLDAAFDFGGVSVLAADDFRDAVVFRCESVIELDTVATVRLFAYAGSGAGNGTERWEILRGSHATAVRVG